MSKAPVNQELFDRTAPRWNCVDFPGEGMHYLARDGSCQWCGMTKQEIAQERKAPGHVLDDTSRTVEIITAGHVEWETTGNGNDVAYWLGNASEHDHEVIRKMARELSPGQALRITFPSVMTFLLRYAGNHVYHICVPTDDTES